MNASPSLFVAGATGVVGTEVVRLAGQRGVAATPHMRPGRARAGHVLTAHPKTVVFELTETDRLVAALRGHTAVLQLIGTMRHRFKSGDTYESSDIGTTALLVDAAKQAGVPHIVLLGAVGAGSPIGAYMKAKAEAERIVRESGLTWTIVRPSSFIGGPHKPPPGMAGGLRLIGALGLKDTALKFMPITVTDLAGVILDAGISREPKNAVLEGRTLWARVERTST
jgi:uncharacterized protein YbjT (DUF2867 family)